MLAQDKPPPRDGAAGANERYQRRACFSKHGFDKQMFGGE